MNCFGLLKTLIPLHVFTLLSINVQFYKTISGLMELMSLLYRSEAVSAKNLCSMIVNVRSSTFKLSSDKLLCSYFIFSLTGNYLYF